MPFVRRLVLGFRGLSPALDGLRIAQISDVHVGLFVSPAQLRLAMEEVAREQPDLFVATGDLVDDRQRVEETVEALGLVRPRLGSFACLGNHEHYTGIRPVRAAFERSPVGLLVNEAVRVTVPAGSGSSGAARSSGAATLELSAVDYPLGRGVRMTSPERFDALADLALGTRAPGGDFRLHLAHHPHAWDAARRRGAHLTLSGHTHGGQIVPFGRPLFAPFFRYIRGLYEEGEQRLFVHSGTGHWLPLRIGCPAEIAILVLRRLEP